MKVGFTGTHTGLTPLQLKALSDQLKALKPTWLHHGDCIGADAAAHRLAKDLGLRVALHPPANGKARAFSSGADRVFPPEPYLDRNRKIVLETDVLVACPSGKTERLRSGTWATVRFARKQGRQVILIPPPEEKL